MNGDVTNLVVELLEPQPALFFKLAYVNRLFYKSFTSDRAWKYLNPYNYHSNIIQSFRDHATTADRKILRENLQVLRKSRRHFPERRFIRCTKENRKLGENPLHPRTLRAKYKLPLYQEWQSVAARLPPRYPPNCSLFVLLDFYACSSIDWKVPIIFDRQVAWCAVHINPLALAHAPLDMREDVELCLKLITLNTEAFLGVSNILKRDLEFCTSVAKDVTHPYARQIIFPQACESEDTVLRKIKSGEINVDEIPLHLDFDSKVFSRAAEHEDFGDI